MDNLNSWFDIIGKRSSVLKFNVRNHYSSIFIFEYFNLELFIQYYNIIMYKLERIRQVD